ncbi:MAG: hypothetical protein ABSC77_11545 [Terracidiphilus sp.]|jgi:hypothetical protein
MRENLAGRLTWEPTGNGICVEIPARRSWTIVIQILWLIVWCGAGWLALNRLHAGHQAASNIPLIWIVGWAVGVLFITISIFWGLSGSTTLELNSSQLRITRHMMGLQLGTRSCANADVRNLRFIPNMIRGRSNVPSHISFEVNGKTRSFGWAVAEKEALALFGKMEQTYKFPRGSTDPF